MREVSHELLTNAWVNDLSSNASFEEARTAIAAECTVMLSTRFVATHTTHYCCSFICIYFTISRSTIHHLIFALPLLTTRKLKLSAVWQFSCLFIQNTHELYLIINRKSSSLDLFTITPWFLCSYIEISWTDYNQTCLKEWLTKWLDYNWMNTSDVTICHNSNPPLH